MSQENEEFPEFLREPIPLEDMPKEFAATMQTMLERLERERMRVKYVLALSVEDLEQRVNEFVETVSQPYIGPLFHNGACYIQPVTYHAR